MINIELMNNREILNEIRNLSPQEQRNLPYEQLVQIITRLNVEERIELSNIIGYPVFTRKCMSRDINRLVTKDHEGGRKSGGHIGKDCRILLRGQAGGEDRQRCDRKE